MYGYIRRKDGSVCSSLFAAYHEGRSQGPVHMAIQQTPTDVDGVPTLAPPRQMIAWLLGDTKFKERRPRGPRGTPGALSVLLDGTSFTAPNSKRSSRATSHMDKRQGKAIFSTICHELGPFGGEA